MRDDRARSSTIVARSFAVGMIVAMCYVTGFILLERAVFESIFDFSNELRVTGPFFTMHIGDQHVDAFLSLAFPWVAYPILVKRSFRNDLCSLSLFALALYATFATMSRGTIAAVSIEVVVLLVMVWLRGSQSRIVAFRSVQVASEGATFAERKADFSLDPSLNSQARVQDSKGSRGSVAWGVMFFAFIVCTIAVSILAMSGDSAVTKRFGSITKDLRGRWDHWRECVFRDDLTPMQIAFGNGVGTLPSWMAKHRGLAVPPLSESTSSGFREVTFQPGWPIYLEHWLGSNAPQTYKIHMSVSTTDANATGSLALLRCQKSLLSSYNCESRSFRIESAGKPTELEIEVASPNGDSDESFWHAWRPESIGVSNAGSTGLLIQRSSIQTDSEVNTLSESEAPPTTWCFTCDDHLVWRAKNAWVHIFFEQGIFGIVAAFWLAIGLLRPVLNFQNTKSPIPSIVLISTIGFSIVATFGTLIDTAWITALLFSTLLTTYPQGPLNDPLRTLAPGELEKVDAT